jgi:hypothetical protein
VPKIYELKKHTYNEFGIFQLAQILGYGLKYQGSIFCSIRNSPLRIASGLAVWVQGDGESGHGVKLTAHLSLVLRLRMPHREVVSKVRKNFAFLESALHLICACKNIL